MSNRIIPNRPAQRVQRTQQPKKQEESVVNLFKRAEDRPITPRVTSEEYWENKSIRNKMYGINTTPTIRNTVNNFSKIVRNEDLKEARLIGEYSVIDLPIEVSNRLETFYAPGGSKVAYNEITKVEEIEASKYSSDPTFGLKANGFTKFYQLYKKNEFNVEVKLCRMATR